MIEKSKKVTIGKKTFIVDFPNVGQILDIESMKQALTNNRYGVMVSSNVRSAYYALDIVDAVSFLTIAAPSIGKYYNVSNYTELLPDKIQEFVTLYQEQLCPWYEKTLSELRNPVSDESGVETQDNA